jgi:hypothetical protein
MMQSYIKRLFFAVVLLVTMQNYCFAGLPVGYQDAKWGMSKDEVRSLLRENAIDEFWSRKNSICVSHGELSDWYLFKDDKLYEVSISLDLGPDAALWENEQKKASKIVIDSLTKKYGKPNALRTPGFDGIYGKTFRTVWKDKDTKIEYLEYLGINVNVWNNKITYSSIKLIDQYNKKQDEENRKNIKNNLEGKLY